jgi:hypothetical protein
MLSTCDAPYLHVNLEGVFLASTPYRPDERPAMDVLRHRES